MTRCALPLCVILLAAGLSACNRDIPPGRTATATTTVTGLPTVTVAQAPVPGSHSFVGTVESSDHAVLVSRVDGRVGRILVREGAAVRAGELLLTIEQTTAGEQVTAADGSAAAAAAQLLLAEQTRNRYRRLRQDDVISQQELDRVEAAHDSAREEHRAALARLAQARTTLSLSRITAPHAGRVGQRQVETGSTVLPGTPLLTIDRTDRWQVRLDVPESWLTRLTIGETLPVEIPALNRTVNGIIAEITPASNPVSRSFQVKVAIPVEPGLTAGLFARAVRQIDPEQALLLPTTALVTRGQLTGVYVVEAGILRYRLVKTGRRLGGQIEILSGLRPGERVVGNGVERARNGARLEE